ncbi:MULTISPECIES: ferrous iron transport protein B [unclassified Nitratiruptor]|uniref:ferrous iron transport protein B n=1 Tax=unclassified Nitratiruptor TaxID=2624044 RepID=UPI00191619F2|nr:MULTISPECIES: ferrous iron transport protein B [unclassified Nitratiruptor]BCD59368.1 ferrous iron transport protein B [Nitratiruptor sp. YY08-10]BCD63292.1 ferrous iron transport protein B [Nitratiruptor sp. YY08-14]
MITIAFVGNPNVGKTALINDIAGSDLQVGNWPGVTVEKKEVTFTYHDEKIHLIDLPGTYTLTPYSIEEKVTRNVICSEQIDGIINVVDVTDIRRNMYLTLELIDLQKPLVIALNMFDEFSKRGYELDIDRLQEILGVACVPTIGSKGVGTKRLIQEIFKAVQSKKKPNIIFYQEHIEKEIAFLIKKMESEDCGLKRFFAIKLLEGDEFAIRKVVQMDPAIVQAAKEARERLQRHFGMSVKEFIVQDRYQKIDKILDEVLKKPLVDRVLLSDRIDNFVLHKWLGIPFFVVIMFLMFKITFDGSAPIVDWMNGFFENFLASHLRASMHAFPPWMVSLFVDGVLSGVGLVLSFLPLLAFLYFFMALLEESGYMARVSFLLDRLAAGLGVKGNAFISLIVGFGCNVPAVYSTRTLNSLRERIIVTLMIPFMSCSARLPIYALFTALFFTHYQALIILSMYLLGIVVALFVGFLANRLLPKQETKPFFLELPTYHMPTLQAIWRSMKPRLADFVTRAGTVIVAASIIVWAIMSLPPSSTPQTSYLAKTAQKIAPLFKPLGFGEHWEPVAALIPGTLAKEVVIGSLGTIYGVENEKKEVAKTSWFDDLLDQAKALQKALKESLLNITTLQIASLQGEQTSSLLMQKLRSQIATPAAALSYMIFVLLYIPCVSTMAAIKEEFGWKLMVFEVLFLPVLAYFITFFLYLVAKYFL